jgi:uncharacterized protein YprB with RNaseH-like and TPR domain
VGQDRRNAIITVASFDLECSSLNADFGIVLCGVVKPQDGEPIVFRGDELNKKWRSKRSDDSALVKAIVGELGKYDILAAHNGLKFDVPYLRTRCARWGLSPVPRYKLIDPVLIARRSLKMSYNGLERIADFLGVNCKTPVEGRLWLQASLDGDKEAMDKIVDHCVKDVEMLEYIIDAVKGYIPAFDSKGSWS